ncbi:protein NYNRIN-like isoform X2 [Portunus trituberculatus]|uniref:protein NYNRIN-like isoform X2 n=1 Tax=Portunus trituberculatus TaxID=210409 RepID=UPI001E1CBF0E|nr:protein NYNRIN-like isoform X2 [Portunus trituberculatus]
MSLLSVLVRVAVDLVGPLSPPSSEGHRYILILIDYATGLPEAVPLKEIDSISVAEALLSIFARVGIPREIFTGQDTQRYDRFPRLQASLAMW